MNTSPSLKILNQYSLPPAWHLEMVKGQGPLLKTSEGLAFCLDFSKKKSLLNSQPLVKALGFKGQALSVLDITAGWTQEAFLISKLGCFVTAVERNPFIFHFVQESLKEQGFNSPQLNFILDNSFNYLNNIKADNKPDVIYMDPMFGDKKKSLSVKALRILKELVGETEDQEALFELARKKAKRRVVVKRHRLESSLQKDSLCTFQGRSVCYDVFKPIM